jgi:hypothetical protein
MASQVTKANLASESRNNVVALLTETNVVDPTITSASESRKWIYSRQPDVKSAGFKGYPYLIVHSSNVDMDKERRSCDGKSKRVLWLIEVEVVTSDRAYGDQDGKGLAHSDSITDDVLETFNDITNRQTLSNNSMKFSEPTTTQAIAEPIENEITYRRSVMLPFRSKIQVSS